jgi:hypothetical protein
VKKEKGAAQKKVFKFSTQAEEDRDQILTTMDIIESDLYKKGGKQRKKS